MAGHVTVARDSHFLSLIEMNDSLVKAAIILAIAIICSVALWVYFSPYHTCVRSGGNELSCAAFIGGYKR